MFKAIGFAFVLSAASFAHAAAADDAALAPIHQFADGMNGGDAKKAADAYAASAPIIDEFPPHLWVNFASWNHDADVFFKAGGVSDFHMTLSAPSLKRIGAAQAYIVVPTTLTFKTKGKPTVEKGIFTFTTAKGPAGWKIAGWAWTTL